MKPVQIIQNGDFSDGLAGWSVWNATTSISNSIVTVTKGSSTSGGGRLTPTIASINTSHIYYFKCVCRYGTTSSRFGFFNSSGSAIADKSVTVSNTNFVDADIRVSPSSETNTIRLYTGITTTKAGLYSEFKSIFCIDLTATFGAGNEPTIEGCREIFTEDYYEYNLSNIVYGRTANDLLLQRRIMMKDVNLPANYITDGLELWLDGINKGGTERHWIDRISGADFIGNPSVAPTALIDCWEFNGSQNFYDNTYLSPLFTSGTIEIVFSVSSLATAQALYTPKQSSSSRLAFYINESSRIFISSGNTTSRRTYSTNITANTIVSVSASTDRGYVNGSALTSAANSYIAGTTSYNYIGKRRSQGSSSGNNFFTGKIYSIRLYSKKLSAEEVAHNYEVDRKRFRF